MHIIITEWVNACSNDLPAIPLDAQTAPPVLDSPECPLWGTPTHTYTHPLDHHLYRTGSLEAECVLVLMQDPL